MMSKTSIIDTLGERALLLPQTIAAALAANDRLKLCFTLLQAAERHADRPEETVPDLSAGLALDGNAGLEIASSRRDADGSLHVPGAERVRQVILKDLAAMLAPLALVSAPTAEAFSARERLLEESLASFAEDRVPKGVIAAMTRASAIEARASGRVPDSVHLLVMDLHRALNALQSSLSEETLDGARVWRIAEEDRPPIRAFMAGLNDTAPLKFNHPGLGTTATRAGGKLVIQNDIGTTDAHVLVLHVEGLKASMTYTDVHARRLAFFQSLFKPFAVRWSESQAHRDEKLADDGEYFLTVATFEADDAQSLERYLTYLGSRLVFLIDWNRARKQLREFLPKADAVRLLKWAADNKLGHRGFLELGGERLLGEAIDFAQRTPLRYGERLHEALGVESAFDYLQFVLREATTGLLQRRSERFIRDEIKAELARRFRSTHASLLGIALTHAERVFDLATLLNDGIAGYAEGLGSERLDRLARRASGWEQECDAIVSRIRSLAERTSQPGSYADLMHQADEAADGLEEAAFLMTQLVAVAPAPKWVGPVQALTTLLVGGAQESVRMYESARYVTREGAREDFQDFLAAVDRLVAIEHETDTAERVVTTALLTSPVDARTLHLLSRLTDALEGAADALSHSALRLRDQLLREIMTG